MLGQASWSVLESFVVHFVVPLVPRRMSPRLGQAPHLRHKLDYALKQATIHKRFEEPHNATSDHWRAEPKADLDIPLLSRFREIRGI
jgi:hypothetical protein